MMLVFQSASCIANMGSQTQVPTPSRADDVVIIAAFSFAPKSEEFVVGRVTIENVLFHRRYNRAPSFVVNPELLVRGNDTSPDAFHETRPGS